MTLQEATFQQIIEELARRFDVGVVGTLRVDKIVSGREITFKQKVRFWGNSILMVALSNVLNNSALALCYKAETPDVEA